MKGKKVQLKQNLIKKNYPETIDLTNYLASPN